MWKYVSELLESIVGKSNQNGFRLACLKQSNFLIPATAIKFPNFVERFQISPKLATYEPRRRGRKRGALNSAFRDRFMREQDALAIENLKRDLNDDGELIMVLGDYSDYKE